MIDVFVLDLERGFNDVLDQDIGTLEYFYERAIKRKEAKGDS